MDDGWRHKKHRVALFCTDSFQKEEVEMLVSALLNKFDIKSKINKFNRIVIYKENVDKLSELIKPYIIPSMTYKLRM